MIWEVTRACELKCVHCRADAQLNPDPRELTYQEGLKLIDEIYEMDNPSSCSQVELYARERIYLT